MVNLEFLSIEKCAEILKDETFEYNGAECVVVSDAEECYRQGYKDAIDKACECHGVLVGNLQLTVKEDAGGYPYIPIIELYDYEKDVPLVKKGDKVKVLIFKEE